MIMEYCASPKYLKDRLRFCIVPINVYNQTRRVKQQQRRRCSSMYYRDSLKLKFAFTAMISLLLGVVQGTEYQKIERRVGIPETLGPCKNDKNISRSMVLWEVHKDGKKTYTVTENRPADGDRIQLVKDYYGESNLVIKSIKEADAGRYICKTGAPDNLKKILEIELIVQVRPELQWASLNQTVNEGETHEMWCNATGIPLPNIEWFRRSRVNNGTSYERIGISGNMLRIHNVTRYAKDVYMCRASNDLDSVEGKINLDVAFPAQLEVLEKELQRSNTDTGVEMVCAVTANPMVNIVWYKGDEEIPFQEKPYKYKVNTEDDMKEEYYTVFSILKIISTLDQADFDIYYCKAQNDSGHVVANETITLARYIGE